MQTITQTEVNASIQRGKLEAIAILLFPADKPFHYRRPGNAARVLRSGRDATEMDTFGIRLAVLRAAVESSPMSPAMYAEEILRDAQDANARDMFAAGNCLLNQARWVLLNTGTQS